jgi:hypothetical protein
MDRDIYSVFVDKYVDDGFPKTKSHWLSFMFLWNNFWHHKRIPLVIVG